MVSCTKCGQENEDNSKYCSNCDAELTQNNTAESAEITAKKKLKDYINYKAIMAGLIVFIIGYFIIFIFIKQYLISLLISVFLMDRTVKYMTKESKEDWINFLIISGILIIGLFTLSYLQ